MEIFIRNTDVSVVLVLPHWTNNCFSQDLIHELFLGGGYVDTCNGGMHASVHPLRFLYILIKFWTYLRARVIRFSFNALLKAIIILYFVIVLCPTVAFGTMRVIWDCHHMPK